MNEKQPTYAAYKGKLFSRNTWNHEILKYIRRYPTDKLHRCVQRNKYQVRDSGGRSYQHRFVEWWIRNVKRQNQITFSGSSFEGNQKNCKRKFFHLLSYSGIHNSLFFPHRTSQLRFSVPRNKYSLGSLQGQILPQLIRFSYFWKMLSLDKPTRRANVLRLPEVERQSMKEEVLSFWKYNT